jgi:hypothetical protein
MLPSPTAAPTEARIKANRPDQFSFIVTRPVHDPRQR